MAGTLRVATPAVVSVTPTPQDLVAGMVAAIVTLAGWLTIGLLAYLPLGAAAAETGIPAACVTVSLGALIVAALGRSALPTGGLSSATTLIYATAVAALAADPLLHLEQPGALPTLVAAASFCVVMMGLVQALFGLLRLGSLAGYVPQPVLAGFMNGVAVLVLLAQLPMLLGIAAPAWARDRIGALAQAQPATLAIGLATAAAVWIVAWRLPRAPAALLGLAFGCLAYAAVHFALPAVRLGPLAGSIPAHGLRPDALVPLFGPGGGRELLARHGRDMLVTALLLAIVGSLETILNARATDQALHTRHNPNRELLAYAAGNLACGIFGGLPLVNWRTRARALTRNGAASRWAAAACALITGLLLFTGGRLIALLPLTVLAGLMVTVASRLSDGWTGQLLARGASSARSRDRWLNLGLVAVVFGLTLSQGVVAGVAVGILLAMALFVQALNRSLVRARYSAAEQPSRRIYPAIQEAVLRDARRQIAVVEIEGALFFGNAERLAAELEVQAAARFVVLDLKRISTIDASGATLLAQIGSRLAKEDRSLMLAGVSAENRHGRALRPFVASGASGASGAPGAAAPRDSWFTDSDQAIEAAERSLLAQAGVAIDDAEFALADCSLLKGLDPHQRARLQAVLQPRQVAAHELLFHEGDAGDCIYVLTRGSITVSSAGGAEHDVRRRYLSLSPGMMLGETAMLDGGGRTADAVADAPSVVHALSRDALEQLRREDPVLVGQLMANIALHLSERLRHAALAWRAIAA